jgi:glucose/arabinose dehydrogenase/cytochrome c2
VNAKRSSEHEPEGGRAWLESLLIAGGLTLAVSLRAFEPIWDLDSGLLAIGLLTGIAYLAGSSAHRRSARRGLGRAALITIVVSQPLLLALWLLDLGGSRVVLVAELALLFVAVAWAGRRWPEARARLPIAFAFAAVSSLPTLARVGRLDAGASVGPERRFVFTSYVDLSLTEHRVAHDELQDGGAMTLLPDGRVLLVTGSGSGWLLDFSAGLETSPLEVGLPLDVAAYRTPGRHQPEFYRVFDVVYDEGTLLASYVHWDPTQGCFALRLAEAAFDGSTVGTWTTRFETRPCVVASYVPNTSGGRIAVLSSSRLLLTTGNFGVDYDLVEKSDYGKVVEIDRRTWEHEVFTSGHRNPEGLLVDGDRIWSTEHGAHGGDELNLLTKSESYGWPWVSYGTDYGKKTLASGAVPGDHADYTAPVYAWVPSVGISNLITVSGDLFPQWRNDLLVGALSGLGNGEALFRVRLLEGRAVSIERIPTGSRVRDLLELPNGGPLVLWDGRGSVRILRPATHVFSTCSGCHGIRNAAHGIGPDLFGVVGAPVARHADYAYSAALRRYGHTWTTGRLDRFLESPNGEVPGTSMEHAGIADPEERAEIIQFLRDISAGRRLD